MALLRRLATVSEIVQKEVHVVELTPLVYIIVINIFTFNIAFNEKNL